MQERQRHQYLSALGIENYVPRRIISGAPSPTLLPDELLLGELSSHSKIPDQTAELHEGQNQPANETVSKIGSKIDNEKENAISSEQRLSVPSLLGQFDKETSQPITGDNERTQELIQASSDNIHSNEDSEKPIGLLPVEFVLSIWRITDDFLVIDSRQPETALPTDRLLQNIVRIIGYSLAQLPPSETIRWPFLMDKRSVSKRELSKEQHANEVNQARAMVQAYITAQASKMPIKTLLLMGENATLYSLDNAAGFEQLSGSLTSVSTWDANIVVTPSLFSMLQEPLKKKVAWKALQHILR